MSFHNDRVPKRQTRKTAMIKRIGLEVAEFSSEGLGILKPYDFGTERMLWDRRHHDIWQCMPRFAVEVYEYD